MLCRIFSDLHNPSISWDLISAILGSQIAPEPEPGAHPLKFWITLFVFTRFLTDFARFEAPLNPVISSHGLIVVSDFHFRCYFPVEGAVLEGHRWNQENMLGLLRRRRQGYLPSINGNRKLLLKEARLSVHMTLKLDLYFSPFSVIIRAPIESSN